MDILTYKVLHLLGVFMILTSLGSLCVNVGAASGSAGWRKILSITHGVGLVLALVAGFGMLAKYGMMTSIPAWAFAKMAIWFVLGGLVVLIKRLPQSTRMLWWIPQILAVLAAYLGIYKPF